LLRMRTAEATEDFGPLQEKFSMCHHGPTCHCTTAAGTSRPWPQANSLRPALRLQSPTAGALLWKQQVSTTSTLYSPVEDEPGSHRGSGRSRSERTRARLGQRRGSLTAREMLV
jgi:hypothetical protein